MILDAILGKLEDYSARMIRIQHAPPDVANYDRVGVISSGRNPVKLKSDYLSSGSTNPFPPSIIYELDGSTTKPKAISSARIYLEDGRMIQIENSNIRIFPNEMPNQPIETLAALALDAIRNFKFFGILGDVSYSSPIFLNPDSPAVKKPVLAQLESMVNRLLPPP